MRGILRFRLTRVVARPSILATRILLDTADFQSIGLVLLGTPIAGPFPDIADHIVQAVAVGRECGDARNAFEAISREILVRKITLPGVRHMPTAGELFVTLSEFRPGYCAARVPTQRLEHWVHAQSCIDLDQDRLTLRT